jgi:hypothetical protein
MADDLQENINAQLMALGRFIEAFELMVDEVSDYCVMLICRSLASTTENHPLVEIAFHHQVMTAKPLYDIMRAIIAEIISVPSNFHLDERGQIKDLLSYIEVAYSNLYSKKMS